MVSRTACCYWHEGRASGGVCRGRWPEPLLSLIGGLAGPSPGFQLSYPGILAELGVLTRDVGRGVRQHHLTDLVVREDLRTWSETAEGDHSHDPDVLESHADAALTPCDRLRLARAAVEDGWTISYAAAVFNVSWPTEPGRQLPVAGASSNYSAAASRTRSRRAPLLGGEPATVEMPLAWRVLRRPSAEPVTSAVDHLQAHNRCSSATSCS
jgi:hypothetical protein